MGTGTLVGMEQYTSDGEWGGAGGGTGRGGARERDARKTTNTGA